MNAVTKDFATEQGHWYCPKTGEPRYTIVGKNGKERNTTIRDAREHGYVVSVTTILKQAAAPNLVNWFKEQVAKAAYLQPPREGESEQDFIARTLPLAEEVSRKARDRGTDIHGAIEKLDRHGPYAAHVDAAMSAVSEWAGLLDWAPERSFASKLGYGGKIDLSGPGFVADFKTTDKPLEDLKLWPDHRRQLAAYRMGLDMPDARCAIVYVRADVPQARVIEVTAEELEQGWREFLSLRDYYYFSNRLELPK